MKKAYLSSEAHEAIKSYLTAQGYELETIDYPDITYYPVSTHPDIFMCRLGVWDEPAVFPGNPQNLRPSYPGNIIYNAVCTGKYFIHNLKYTDALLADAASEWKASLFRPSASDLRTNFSAYQNTDSSQQLVKIDVAQGYTRCCCLPVDDSSFITSDDGVAKVLCSAGAEVLVIDKGHIALPEFNYGFIGGCAGHILLHGECAYRKDNRAYADCTDQRDGYASGATYAPCDRHDNLCDDRRTILFNGNLSAHPDFKRIVNFIHERNIDVAYFQEYPLTDIGSILALW